MELFPSRASRYYCHHFRTHTWCKHRWGAGLLKVAGAWNSEHLIGRSFTYIVALGEELGERQHHSFPVRRTRSNTSHTRLSLLPSFQLLNSLSPFPISTNIHSKTGWTSLFLNYCSGSNSHQLATTPTQHINFTWWTGSQPKRYKKSSTVHWSAHSSSSAASTLQELKWCVDEFKSLDLTTSVLWVWPHSSLCRLTYKVLYRAYSNYYSCLSRIPSVHPSSSAYIG